MDRVYRPQRHIYDLTRKYYLLGRDRLIAGLALEPGSSLIEVGCGTGRNLIAIARRYPQARLYGLDASQAMLEIARTKIGAAGLEDRIVLRQGLAEELSASQFGRESFDHVLFSYCLSMVPDWQGALFAAGKTLSESGHWHVVDFADLKGLGGFARKALLSWLELFHVTPRTEFLVSLERVSPRMGQLTLLKGRYAFIFRSAPGTIWRAPS
ncbi:MAG TPA: class I SAM-dependent methyltransferase [Rhizomicrobium sp.]|nr:class I SAM-dependent methyltransferase [Rhizomicrobium sp.]